MYTIVVLSINITVHIVNYYDIHYTTPISLIKIIILKLNIFHLFK